MKILDQLKLKKLSNGSYMQSYPFLNGSIPELIRPEFYEELCKNFPAKEYFEFRPYDQTYFSPNHKDFNEEAGKYILMYEDIIGKSGNDIKSKSINLSDSWKYLINDLQSDEYKETIAKIAKWDPDDLEISIEWQIYPTGGEQPPHMDTYVKLVPHLFYFNPDWSSEWGGETSIFGFADGMLRKQKSQLSYNDFDIEFKSPCAGNTSMLFVRDEKSWHGVRPTKNPKGTYRKTMLAVALSKKNHTFIHRKIMLNNFLSSFLPIKFLNWAKRKSVHRNYKL